MCTSVFAFKNGRCAICIFKNHILMVIVIADANKMAKSNKIST